MEEFDGNPITPDAALNEYLNYRQFDLRDSTLRTHKDRITSFVNYLKSQDINNMNDVDLNVVNEYRVYKRENNGDNQPCNSVTMQGQVSTIRVFLNFLTENNHVPESLPNVIRLPRVEGDGSDDQMLDKVRANAILDFLQEYHYASTQHVTILLMWRTSARRGGTRALDVNDFDVDERSLSFKHRPESDTPLKNGESGQRVISLTPHVARVIEDYIKGPNRHRVTDDHNRDPLLTTKNGRVALSTIQNWVYKWTRPCVIGEACPHGYDVESCEFLRSDSASGCPSSVSPHAVRTGSITAFLDSGTPKEILGDRADVTPEIMDVNYDKASPRQQMRRRRDYIPEEI